MFKKMGENKVIIFIVIIGFIITGVVSSALLSANQTIRIWVPSRPISAGTIVTQDMVKQIDYPARAVGGYIENRNLIIGYRLKNSVDVDQLFYPNDFIAAWESYSQDIDVPEDFVITSMQIPNERACGGLIVAGDTIDVLGVSKGGRVSGFDEKSAINGRERIGTNVYYILSNVKIINTNSALSQSQGYELNDILEGASGGGQFYIVALSYDDAKKLRQAEGSLELWLNIAPRQNVDNEPLISQMVGQSWSGLHDAQKQVSNPDGTPVEGVPQVDQEGMQLYPEEEGRNNLNDEFRNIYEQYQNDPSFNSDSTQQDQSNENNQNTHEDFGDSFDEIFGNLDGEE